MFRGASACRFRIEPHHRRVALTKWGAVRYQHDAPRPRDIRTTLKDLLFYNRAPLVLGLCIGGLGASIAGAIYIRNYSTSIDLPQLLQVLQYKIEWQVKPKAGGESDDSSPVAPPFVLPGSVSVRDVFPLVTVVFWSVSAVTAFLFATGRTHLNLHFKQFMEHVNFSLNYIEGNTLKFRTIKECKLSDLLSGNRAAVDMILNSAKETSSKQPFLLLPRSSSAFVSNSILNTISPAFTEGFFWAAQGLPVVKKTYRFGLSFEKEATTVLKLRVMLCSDELLQMLKEDKMPEFEAPIHRFRWIALKNMARVHHNSGRLAAFKLDNISMRMFTTHTQEFGSTSSTHIPLGTMEVCLPDYAQVAARMKQSNIDANSASQPPAMTQ